MMINIDREEIDNNLLEWQVISYSSKSIEIALQFENPLLISQGDYPDVLVI